MWVLVIFSFILYRVFTLPLGDESLLDSFGVCINDLVYLFYVLIK